MRVLLVVVALAGCTVTQPRDLPPPDLPQRAGVDPIVAARAEGVTFMAHGDAPVFQLRFYDDRITLLKNDAELETYPLPEPMHPRWYGEVYITSNDAHRLRIEVRRDHPCEGQPGQVVVRVARDGVNMDGCGRDL
jgi:hypothetical protein